MNNCQSHDNFYEWASCEVGLGTKDTKRPLSHLSPILREGKKGEEESCQSNHSKA